VKVMLPIFLFLAVQYRKHFSLNSAKETLAELHA